MINLNECQDLNIYKKLAIILFEYTNKFPGTQVSELFEKVLNGRLNVIPKDEKSLKKLEIILNENKSIPIIVQNLLNNKILILKEIIKKEK